MGTARFDSPQAGEVEPKARERVETKDCYPILARALSQRDRAAKATIPLGEVTVVIYSEIACSARSYERSFELDNFRVAFPV
jgi:hypothetical protein